MIESKEDFVVSIISIIMAIITLVIFCSYDTSKIDSSYMSDGIEYPYSES